jgi:glycerol-3-phosphate acyltransferase PlsY
MNFESGLWPYLLACYVLGALPTGYLAGRLLKGIDIRTQGSGNMGATNVFRVLGKGPGVLVLLIDIAKGAACVAFLTRYFNLPHSSAPLLGGIAAVLGHNYTVFLGFKGGKGVATSAGVCLGLAPWSFLSIVAVFIVLFALTRMVSVGSLAAATTLPAFMWYHGEAGTPQPQPGQVFWLGVVLAVFVWLRHIPNIKRILSGTENRFGKKT